MADNNSSTTVSTPIISVQNLIANPHSVTGWLGVVASLAVWGSGLVGESTGAMISDAGMLAVSLASIILPSVVKTK